MLTLLLVLGLIMVDTQSIELVQVMQICCPVSQLNGRVDMDFIISVLMMITPKFVLSLYKIIG